MAKKVLVVDDEKLIVKGIRFSLEQDGMEVDCAYDGEEALNMAKANEYDMILLDIMLPKMDGFEVCQAIREFSDMPIVMPFFTRSSSKSNSFAVRFTSLPEINSRLLSQSRRRSPFSTIEETSFFSLGPAVRRMIALIRAFTSRILNGFVI